MLTDRGKGYPFPLSLYDLYAYILTFIMHGCQSDVSPQVNVEVGTKTNASMTWRFIRSGNG
jgi:hypothetical protein